MPPKKRKAATASNSDGNHTMWLVIYESKGYEEERKEVLYSTKEKAISGLPNLMDKFANIENDWRDGIEGFGREEEDPYPYSRFKYFGDDIIKKSNKDGGILLSNAHWHGVRSPITVSIKRMLVDPPDSEVGR